MTGFYRTDFNRPHITLILPLGSTAFAVAKRFEISSAYSVAI